MRIMNAGVKQYQQISRADALSRDPRQREALVLEYAPLVKRIVDRMAIRLPPNIGKDELISGGVMGLFDALDKFDPKRGIKFSTYAGNRIKGAIIDELRKMDWVPTSVRRDMHKIENAIQSLVIKLGREPEDFEVAHELGMDVDSYYRKVTRASGIGLLSFDHVSSYDISVNFAHKAPDSLLPSDELAKKELKGVIAKSLAQLSKKEQLVISLYYYDELTLKEIGQALNLTESRISQIHSKVIIKLRTKLKSYYKG